jgi:hypothetical protein
MFKVFQHSTQTVLATTEFAESAFDYFCFFLGEGIDFSDMVIYSHEDEEWEDL